MKSAPRAVALTLLLGVGAMAPELRDLSVEGRALRLVGTGISVRIETDQADAALAILAEHRARRSIDTSLWERLFATEGYRRLKRREAAMGRVFEDAAFRAYLTSDSMAARQPALAAALAEWKRVDLAAAARLALDYLPASARLRATLYPVIKPRPNSFVFDVGTDSAAIFLYLDPAVSTAGLQNILAHELHHIGYATACSDASPPAVPERVRDAVRWMGAFGEGVAMLAAAGNPDRHPHAVSEPDERLRWDRDVANAPADMGRLERFFLDVLDGRLTEPDSVRAAAMEFFGEQGPWYTVGWLMASTVERTYGRQRLIEILCEPQRLLREYNVAAAAHNRTSVPPLPLWSEHLLARLEF